MPRNKISIYFKINFLILNVSCIFDYTNNIMEFVKLKIELIIVVDTKDDIETSVNGFEQALEEIGGTKIRIEIKK